MNSIEYDSDMFTQDFYIKSKSILKLLLRGIAETFREKSRILMTQKHIFNMH